MDHLEEVHAAKDVEIQMDESMITILPLLLSTYPKPYPSNPSTYPNPN